MTESKTVLPRGIYTALVTPFRDGEIDHAAWERLVSRQVAAGVAGLVPVGCTGEAAALDEAEREWLVRRCVEIADGACAVVAGSGTNVTAGTIALSERTAKWGVDALMLISPYYNKPQQHGLVAHYRAVARAVDTPQVLYNVPGRTAVNIQPATVAELADEPNIIAVKEASGNLDQIAEIMKIPGLQVFSGDDGLNLPIFELGAAGAISVLSNILPGASVRMWDAWSEGRADAARKIADGLSPVVEALFIETNPAPAKTLLDMMGLCDRAPRLPLAPVTDATSGKLADFHERILGPLIAEEPQ